MLYVQYIHIMYIYCPSLLAIALVDNCYTEDNEIHHVVWLCVLDQISFTDPKCVQEIARVLLVSSLIQKYRTIII